MKYSVAILALLITVSAYAGFGGSRGGGFSGGGRSFSSSRSSSFGGYRSSPSVTITRPSYSRPSYSRPAVNATTVIHHDSGSSGFLNGMMMGHILSQPAQPVIVTGGAPAVMASPSQTQAPTQVIVAEETHWFRNLILGFILCGALFYLILFIAAAVEVRRDGDF